MSLERGPQDNPGLRWKDCTVKCTEARGVKSSIVFQEEWWEDGKQVVGYDT